MHSGSDLERRSGRCGDLSVLCTRAVCTLLVVKVKRR